MPSSVKSIKPTTSVYWNSSIPSPHLEVFGVHGSQLTVNDLSESEAMSHSANVSFQDSSMFWNVESPSQLDIGVQAGFGCPSNSHVMIPKQLRCWKAEDTWGKWLWKTETVFQPYSHSVVRSAYWQVFNSSSFSAWPTDYQISDQTFYFPFFLDEIQTPAKEPAQEEHKGGTVPLGCAACSQPLTAYSSPIRLKELQNTNWSCKIR